MPLIALNDFIRNVQFYQSSEYALETLYQQILNRHDILDRLENIDDNKTRIVLELLNHFLVAPDTLWNAIATKEGLSHWFMPTKFEIEEGGRFSFEGAH